MGPNPRSARGYAEHGQEGANLEGGEAAWKPGEAEAAWKEGEAEAAWKDDRPICKFFAQHRW
jgi:hypothetical protein